MTITQQIKILQKENAGIRNDQNNILMKEHQRLIPMLICCGPQSFCVYVMVTREMEIYLYATVITKVLSFIFQTDNVNINR